MSIKLRILFQILLFSILIFPNLNSQEKAIKKPIKKQIPKLVKNIIYPVIFEKNIKEAMVNAKNNDKKVVLIFGSPSCKHCHDFKKEIAKINLLDIANKFYFAYVNVDRDYRKAKKYNVQGTPHVFVLDSQGGIVEEQLGFQSARNFISFLTLKDKKEKISKNNAFGHLPWSPKGYRGESICFSNVGYGPLKLSTQSPFQSLRITYQPRTPSTLVKGEWEAHIQSVWANIWAIEEGDYFLDSETLSNQFNLSYGISDTMQIEFQYDQRSRFGGVGDGFIQGFHDAFGLGQDGRKDVSKENFEVLIEDQNGSDDIRLDNSDRGIYSQNLHLNYQHNITCGSYYMPALSYSVGVRRNIYSSDEVEDDFPIDLSFSVSSSRRWGDTYSYISAGFTYYGQGFLKNIQGLELKKTQMSILIAEEWKFSHRASIVLQFLYTEGAVKNRSPFSKGSNEITVGLNWEFSNQKLFQIGLIENILVFDNSADFGVFASFTVRM